MRTIKDVSAGIIQIVRQSLGAWLWRTRSFVIFKKLSIKGLVTTVGTMRLMVTEGAPRRWRGSPGSVKKQISKNMPVPLAIII